jgi:uncharacterized repeat protein (TIGR03803 family)
MLIGNRFGTRKGRAFIFAAAALTVASLAAPSGASAANFKILYSFCAQGGAACTDGANPATGVIKDAAGNLYGTTEFGGAHGWGVVFELIPSVGAWGQVTYARKSCTAFAPRAASTAPTALTR